MSGLTAGQTSSGSCQYSGTCHAVSVLFSATEVVDLQTSQRELCQAKLRSGDRLRSGYCAFATGESHGVVGYFALCNTFVLLCSCCFHVLSLLCDEQEAAETSTHGRTGRQVCLAHHTFP